MAYAGARSGYIRHAQYENKIFVHIDYGNALNGCIAGS